jgi:hypothetical protein
VTASGFSEPFDTFSDMTHLLRSERTPSQGPSPRGLVYLCSVVEEDPSPSTVCCGEHTQPSAAGQARNVTPRRVDPAEDVALFLLDRAVYLWPGAIASAQTSAADQKAPQSLDDSLVIGIAPGADTIEKVVKSIRTPHARSPYVRLNSAPSDRYILSLPGSAALRIHPGNTGYDNLFAAGDWTACILNAGCIEAAAISGMLAAESLLRTQLAIIGREERPHGRT